MKYNEDNLRVNWLDWVTLALVIIGALNWGLVGIGIWTDMSLNVVNMALGWAPDLEALVYVLVGLAGLYQLYFAYKLRIVEEQSSPRRADSTAETSP